MFKYINKTNIDPETKQVYDVFDGSIEDEASVSWAENYLGYELAEIEYDDYLCAYFLKGLSPINVNIEIRKKYLLAKNNYFYSKSSNEIVVDVPKEEQETWFRQSGEAIAWSNNPAHPTPFIDILANIRNIDRNELIQRVLFNTNKYLETSATLTGIRQKLEDVIMLCSNIEDLPTEEEIKNAYSILK